MKRAIAIVLLLAGVAWAQNKPDETCPKSGCAPETLPAIVDCAKTPEACAFFVDCAKSPDECGVSTITAPIDTYEAMVIRDHGEDVVTIGMDGKVTLAKDVKPDEAAKLFWDAVTQYFPCERKPEKKP